MAGNTFNLDVNQRALLRALNGSFFPKWTPGVEVTSRYLDVDRIRSFHMTEVNEMVAFAKAMRDAGLLEVRPNPLAATFKWDMRITANGKRHIRGKKRYVPLMTGLAIAVTACSSFSPQPQAASEAPPRATIPSRSVVGQPNMVQVRDPASGLVSWRYCSDDCPVPTQKILATAVAAVEIPPKPSQGGAQTAQGQVVQGLVTALQTQTAQTPKGDSQKPATNTVVAMPATQTLSYAVFFQPGSAKLTKDGKEAIKELAPDIMRADGVTIVGRADPSGPQALNERLSKARGEAVKSVLVSEGIDRSKIDIEARVGAAKLDPKMTALTATPVTIAEQSRRTDLAVDLLVLKAR